MDEVLTTEESTDLRVILVRFMADKEAHKKIPRLEVGFRNSGIKLTACTSISRKRTKIGAEAPLWENEYNH